MSKAAVTDMTIAGAARSIRRGECSPVELTQMVLARIAATEPATATLAGAPNVMLEDGEEPIQVAFARFTMPSITTGQPALSLPCGFDRDGLLIGMQIVGRPYEEGRICAIGRAYQEATAHHQRRPAL